jgi:hypothetical protein
MSDLAEFLRARIAKDEAKAQEALDELAEILGPPLKPYRALLECDVKRRILEIHGSQVQVIRWVDEDRNAADAARGHTWCTECGNIDDRPVAWPCDTLRIVASVYDADPDYRPEWRP